MDQDIIAFSSVKINTKGPNFKVSNAIIRWKNFIFILVGLILVIILSIVYTGINSNVKTKTLEIENFNIETIELQKELQEDASDALNAKKENERLKQEHQGYNEVVAQQKDTLTTLKTSIDSNGKKRTEYTEHIKKLADQKKVLMDEYTSQANQYNELVKTNHDLNAEYEKLGGKTSPDVDYSKYTIKDSQIVSSDEEIALLQQWTAKPLKNLCYKATRNNMDVSVFHKNCDSVGPTIILVKTETNEIIGGYTSASWNDNKDKTDSTAFLFNLGKKNKFNVKSLALSITTGIDILPSFGKDFSLSSHGFGLTEFPMNYGSDNDTLEMFYPGNMFYVDNLEIYAVSQ